MRRLLGTMFGIALGLVFASDAQAILWPAENLWIPLKFGGSDYVDADDESPANTDIRGGLDSLGTNYTAGYYFIDRTNMMFRIRLDDDPTGAQAVWNVMFNTNTNPADTDVDWVLQLDGKNHDWVEFAWTNTPTDFTANPYVELNADHTNHWSKADYSRVTNAPSFFDGNADYFMDIGMPLTNFFLLTGLDFSNYVRVALGTATSDVTLNKDHPDSPPYFSDPFQVPEPSALALAGAGAFVLGSFRRRRR